MDLRKVKKLIELLEESGINEIEIKEGEESIRISRGTVAATQFVASPPLAASPPSAPTAANPDGHVVTAPMVGTYYSSPSPNNPPFVKIGQAVKIGDPLCIIEAMKIMNPIEADRAGTILSILADNGQPVEFEQPLFILS
ncbi:MAG: acetyl-CoA carboxylase biotin carboxyl carrier protein [Gammaproteobacteria bacterium]|nr:acetyl-CoA carboxylase biotin carboxyl carrier protein [Gammaproteobacteria bacterium]